MTSSKWFLYTGDTLTLVILTLIGFATHGETDLTFLTRMGAVFIPMVIAWFIIAPWLGLFQSEITSDPKQLWRPALALLFAVPLAAVLRGLILSAPIIPIFTVVLGATSALAMILWRMIWIWIIKLI